MCCVLYLPCQGGCLRNSRTRPYAAAHHLCADKALLRFLLSGNTSLWSRPDVAYRIGFGTAPWRCISSCHGQFYASATECAPDCTTQTYYCQPDGACQVVIHMATPVQAASEAKGQTFETAVCCHLTYMPGCCKLVCLSYEMRAVACLPAWWWDC